MLSYDEFNTQILELYKELNLFPDHSKFSNVESLGKTIAEMAYYFTPGIGWYHNRHLEITPTRIYNPPSPALYKLAGEGHFTHLLMKIEMNVNIGAPGIMFYPKTTGSTLSTIFSLKKTVKTQYDSFNEKYIVTFKENQKWFFDGLNINIINSLLQLEFPNHSGVMFEFSNKDATFAIVPRSVGKDKLKQALEILDKIVDNIEASFSKTNQLQ